MEKTSTLTAQMTPLQMENFISTLAALSKIDEHVRIKVENDEILLFSLTGVDNAVHAFKSYILKFDEFFNNSKITELDLILTDVKKLCKQLQFYIDSSINIDVEFITMDGTDLGSNKYLVKQMYFNNNIFESFIIGGEPFIIRNLGIQSIKDRADPDIKKYGFNVELEHFEKIIKLTKFDTATDVLKINIKNNIIKFKENKWALEVGKIDLADDTLTFKKKYLNNAELSDHVQIDVFETFIVIRGNKSDLMITLEIKEY